MNINPAQNHNAGIQSTLNVLNTSVLAKAYSSGSGAATSGTEASSSAKPSVQVTFSQQALQLSKASASNESQYSDKDLLNDIFRGVKEQLSGAYEAGSSGADKIKKAGDEFNKILTSIEKEANGKPLNDQQLERLAKADDAFHKVVDQVYGNPPQGAGAAGNSFAASAQSQGGSSGSGSGSGSVQSSGSQASGKSKKTAIHPDDLNKDGKVTAQERLQAKARQAYSDVANNFGDPTLNVQKN